MCSQNAVKESACIDGGMLMDYQVITVSSGFRKLETDMNRSCDGRHVIFGLVRAILHTCGVREMHGDLLVP